jgi:low affinity Fe/Cu permease
MFSSVRIPPFEDGAVDPAAIDTMVGPRNLPRLSLPLPAMPRPNPALTPLQRQGPNSPKTWRLTLIASMGTDAAILPIAPAALVPGRLLSELTNCIGEYAMNKMFGNAATTFARAAGKPVSFMLAALSIVVWLGSGPFFSFSDTWQLVINTGTTIITFLMVFLIQNSQNRDSSALQVKLDELIRVSTVQNIFVGIERLSGEELERVRAKCEARAKAEDRGQQELRN